MHRVADYGEAHPVREPLEEGADLVERGLEVGVARELLVRVLAVAGDGTAVRHVFLDEIEEPGHRFLVVVMALALVDNLYAFDCCVYASKRAYML